MRRKLLQGIEAVVGVSGVAGGVLLALSPDGRLLGMDQTLLKGTAFSDYLVPGLLLALLVGVGGLVGAVLTHRNARHWRTFTAAYGAGVVLFEIVEVPFIGWSPLQAILGCLGVAMLLLALTARLPGLTGRRALAPRDRRVWR